jgi:hypothetical protein
MINVYALRAPCASLAARGSILTLLTVALLVVVSLQVSGGPAAAPAPVVSAPRLEPVPELVAQVDFDLHVRGFDDETAILEGPGGIRLRLPRWLIHLHGAAPLAIGDLVRPFWSSAKLASALGPHLAVLFEFGPTIGMEVVGAKTAPIGCPRRLGEPLDGRADWRLTLHRPLRI